MNHASVFLLLLSALTVPTSSALAQSITTDFENWLDANGYASFEFARHDLSFGSYGGFTATNDQATRDPVVFIHGNSDSAAGWEDSIDYFEAQGYTTAELYATTWGPASVAQAAQQYHSRAHLEHVRAFLEAVLDYTGAEQIDVISHSMGVTLGRKAILGGSAHDALDGGTYSLGGSLTSEIDTFVGIAGANQGLVSCYQTGGTTPTCAATNGLYPGYLWWGLGPFGVSDILDNMNSSVGYEGASVYSIWSTADQVIGYGNLVYGTYTSRIPGQDGEVVYSTLGHFGLKDNTESVQYNLVQ